VGYFRTCSNFLFIRAKLTKKGRRKLSEWGESSAYYKYISKQAFKCLRFFSLLKYLFYLSKEIVLILFGTRDVWVGEILDEFLTLHYKNFLLFSFAVSGSKEDLLDSDEVFALFLLYLIQFKVKIYYYLIKYTTVLQDICLISLRKRGAFG